MRLRSAAVAVIAAASLIVPVAGSASASPTSSGVTVTVQQNGVDTHNVCAFNDVWFAGRGFAPNRTGVWVRVEIIGAGILFYTRIPLSGGSGATDTGQPGPYFIGDKFRVRYEAGSTDHPVVLASWSANIQDC